MDKEHLLRSEVQDFIKQHESDDLQALLLQRKKHSPLPLTEIVAQIQARKKAKVKLPTWYNTKDILFPVSVSVEQASSEITAAWKASFIGQGKSGIDLTGGFGVDSYYFAKHFTDWLHVEPNKDLQEVVRHNAALFAIENTTYVNLTSEEYIEQLEQQVDFIYIDPDRRPTQQRVAGFKDSQPDITTIIPRLRKVANQVLIKASPMIDISAGIKDLEGIKEVIILSVRNEVKEVLFYLDFRTKHSIKTRCVELFDNMEFEFIYNQNELFQEEYKISSLSSFLYEPGAAIMKSGGQDILAKRHGLIKLHRNTNLYTSSILIADFPGRRFKVLANLPYKKKPVAEFLNDNRANLSTRNFIDSPEQMKKKLGLKDGGDFYLFGYRDFENNNKVAVCQKVDNN